MKKRLLILLVFLFVISGCTNGIEEDVDSMAADLIKELSEAATKLVGAKGDSEEVVRGNFPLTTPGEQPSTSPPSSD